MSVKHSCDIYRYILLCFVVFILKTLNYTKLVVLYVPTIAKMCDSKIYTTKYLDTYNSGVKKYSVDFLKNLNEIWTDGGVHIEPAKF